LSPNPDDAYFSASIHEEILNQLVKISSLNVIARTSVLQYADAGLTIPQIAAELNVGAVMECSVRFAGTAIMVTAQLIDPVTDSHLWSDTYPGDLSDLSAVFEMQADIAMNIANALQAEFSTAEQERLGKQVTVSAEAYNSYLRAIAAWRASSPDTSDLLDSAIALDPDFAAAYAAKALHIAGQLFFGIDKTADRERLAIEYAETALSIDPDLAMAHVALAKVHELNWHRAEAEAAYKRVIQLYPRDASVAAAYATFNRAVLNYPEAIRLGRLAASLDPNRPSYWHQLGVTYLHARNDEAASVVLRNALALNPAFTPSIFELGAYQVSRGNLVAAQERFRTVDLTGQWNNVGFLRAMLALGYDRAGLHDDAERAFADVERLSTDNATGSASMAIAYLAIHNYDRAYDALERTINGPELLGLSPSIELKVNRWELPALEEPRFVELRNKLGFQD
jgi:TolB-like protein